jgi:hypothetical protein
MLSTPVSRKAIDSAAKKKLVLIYMLWGSLVVGLATVVVVSFLTRFIPHWVGLIAAVAATGLAPVFIHRILKLRSQGNVSRVP